MVAEVAVSEIPAELPEGEVLLDVREDDEFAAGHAPQAVHLPMSALPDRVADVPEADLVYVICRSGGRSAQVTAYLNAQGRSCVNVAGGMQHWVAAGRDMTSDSGEDPAVI
ncbi:rhodanese-like domain-containing protein [Sciscionella marina]|uniref:rhodanese-like domain-containing protein n=1 Tax=Sciscionella marina TaxID=508770 RepID=UPI00036D72A1|nr:rhodanese-like domain-containing protein [Sciscionella marina]